MPGQDDDRGAEVDAAGAAGEIGEQLRRRRRHRIAGEMVLQREQRVETQWLGEIAHRQMLSDDRGVRAPGLAQHVERGPDLHGTSSGASLPARSADPAARSIERACISRARALVWAPCLGPLSEWGRACTFGPSAGVAEWQTRQTQNLLPVREWGFKSLHPHHRAAERFRELGRRRRSAFAASRQCALRDCSSGLRPVCCDAMAMTAPRAEPRRSKQAMYEKLISGDNHIDLTYCPADLW